MKSRRPGLLLTLSRAHGPRKKTRQVCFLILLGHGARTKPTTCSRAMAVLGGDCNYAPGRRKLFVRPSGRAQQDRQRVEETVGAGRGRDDARSFFNSLSILLSST